MGEVEGGISAGVIAQAQIRVLGPVEAEVNRIDVPLRGGRARVLFALLAYHRESQCSPDMLLDRAWGERATTVSRKALQMQIVRLRRLTYPGAIQTMGSGRYRLGACCQVDADQFLAARLQARAALDRADHPEAVRIAREALSMWRGRPWSDLDDDVEVFADRAALTSARDDIQDTLARALAHTDPAEAVIHLERLIHLRSDPEPLLHLLAETRRRSMDDLIPV